MTQGGGNKYGQDEVEGRVAEDTQADTQKRGQVVAGLPRFCQQARKLVQLVLVQIKSCQRAKLMTQPCGRVQKSAHAPREIRRRCWKPCKCPDWTVVGHG